MRLPTNKNSGFTLIEVLIYTVIFAVSSVFLVGILGTITRVQSRQSSYNELSEQTSFLSNTIQRLVREASLVDMASGVATSTLTLRTTSSTLDPTTIYADASGTAVYIQEGTSTPIAITDSNVTVSNFSVIKFENAGGPSVVQVDVTLTYNTLNPQAQASKSLHFAVTKISAATFDSSILPNSNNAYDIGNSGNNWKDGYFLGSVGIGTAPVSSAKLKTTGNISFSTSSAGIIFTAPNASCILLQVNSSYQLVTSTIACP
ncbi:MAG: prepilin-type N-terminal cleavage/methylation domain-containing protein [Patescibacteria group bacterium]